MKILVTYSSKTGNTEKIANAVYEALKDKDADIKKIADADFGGYDVIVLGYWLKSGTANDEAAEAMKKLSGKKVVLFGTLGAGDYDGYHKQSINNVEKLLPSDCALLDHKLFRCTSIRLKALREQYAKEPNDAQVKWLLEDYEKNANRPDEEDFKDAREFVLAALSK